MGKGRRNQHARKGELSERRKGWVPVQQGKGTFRIHVMKNIHTINNK